ncbi:hypothetical protein L218DRAFT_310294 [Marasmius fiardii PR-910]|nr:hypothetical protein L218DRAFT_310294 [Marasmius fiardii PR-910]
MIFRRRESVLIFSLYFLILCHFSLSNAQKSESETILGHHDAYGHFLERLHYALSTSLGLWERSAVWCVLACGIGVFLQWTWQLAVVVRSKMRREIASADSSRNSAENGDEKGGKMVMDESEGRAVEEEEETTGEASVETSSDPAMNGVEKEGSGENAPAPQKVCTINEDPEAKKVRDWRHRVQKAFLSPNRAIRESDMPAMDQLFTTIEHYDKMNISYLQIGKVMRHIAAFAPEKVPRDEEYHFRRRAKALVDKWTVVLSSTVEEVAVNGATV